MLSICTTLVLLLVMLQVLFEDVDRLVGSVGFRGRRLVTPWSIKKFMKKISISNLKEKICITNYYPHSRGPKMARKPLETCKDVLKLRKYLTYFLVLTNCPRNLFCFRHFFHTTSFFNDVIAKKKNAMYFDEKKLSHILHMPLIEKDLIVYIVTQKNKNLLKQLPVSIISIWKRRRKITRAQRYWETPAVQ